MHKAASNTNIVHESEIQRQHIRIQIPAQVIINEKTYQIKDLSAGGFRLTNFHDTVQSGEKNRRCSYYSI